MVSYAGTGIHFLNASADGRKEGVPLGTAAIMRMAKQTCGPYRQKATKYWRGLSIGEECAKMYAPLLPMLS